MNWGNVLIVYFVSISGVGYKGVVFFREGLILGERLWECDRFLVLVLVLISVFL